MIINVRETALNSNPWNLLHYPFHGVIEGKESQCGESWPPTYRRRYLLKKITSSISSKNPQIIASILQVCEQYKIVAWIVVIYNTKLFSILQKTYETFCEDNLRAPSMLQILFIEFWLTGKTGRISKESFVEGKEREKKNSSRISCYWMIGDAPDFHAIFSNFRWTPFFTQQIYWVLWSKLSLFKIYCHML